MSYVVYKLSHPASDTIYIGQTSSSDRRVAQHHANWRNAHGNSRRGTHSLRYWKWLKSLPTPPKMVVISPPFPTRSHALLSERLALRTYPRAERIGS